MSAAAGSAAVLERALASEDAEERRQATSRLRDLKRDEAIPLLVRSLGDPDWRVRKEATVAARAFSSERALLEALLGKLDDRGQESGFADVGLRNAIVEVLAAAGGAATRLVAERIAKLDGDGRKLAVEILGKSGDPGALKPLEARLSDSDDNVREAAVEAIASLGGMARERVVPVLVRCLDDRDRFVRLTALEGLNALGAPLPWERLEPLVGDPTLRSAALTAAANADSPRAAPALARALASSNGGAFTQAMTALARMAEGPHALRVVEALRAQGPELGQRLLSVADRQEPMSEPGPARPGGFEGFAPEGSADPRAIALVLAAAARAPGVAAAAMEALGEQALAPAASRALCMLGPSALSEVLQRLRAGIAAPVADPLAVEADTHAALVDVAAYIARSPEATAADRARVLEALRLAAQADRRVATGALFHLSRLGTADDLALCAELALSRDVSVAHAAEGALTALVQRHPEDGRKLASSAAERSMMLPAVLALGALGEGEPVLSTPGGDLAFLEQAVASGDARTRRAAVAAVAELAGAAAAVGATSPYDVLAFALADEERSVQLAAARALGRLCVRATEGLSSPPPPRSERDAARLRLHQPRASDVLELVGRSQDDDLLAATVRALADAAALSSRSLAPPPSPRIGATTTSEVEELIAALATLAQSAPSPVAIAAVDALARAPAEERGRLDALIGALDHSDHGVVEATVLKLRGAATDDSRDGRAVREALARCLRHSSPEVRTLASEGLGGSTPPGSGGRGRG